MKILYFTRQCTVHDRRFLRKLASSDNEIYFLALKPGPSPGSLGVRVLNWDDPPPDSGDALSPGVMAPALRSVLDRVKPDIVHAGPIPDCGFIAALSGFHPLLLMSWGSDILLPGPEGEVGTRIQFALEHCDALQCDCDVVRQTALRYAPRLRNSVAQFPWGVDVERFCPRQRLTGAKPFTAEPFTIVSTRSWEPLYDPLTLLAAYCHRVATEPRTRLVMLGGGSLASRIQEFLSTHGIDHKVDRPGTLEEEELPPWFQAADVYISCARSDGSSVSLLQALASGLPVIACDIPANREWIVNGRNGWLVSAGDIEGFSAAIMSAYRLDPEARFAMSAANRRIAVERANWDLNFPLLLEAYQKVHTLHRPSLGETQARQWEAATAAPSHRTGR